MTRRLLVFRDRTGRWRWHVQARNGRLIACSGESFGRKPDCLRSLAGVFPPRAAGVRYIGPIIRG